MYNNSQIQSTTGFQQEVLVGGSAYSNEATLVDLHLTGSDGESGVYTEAGVLKTTALVINEVFIPAVKKSGQLVPFAPFVFGPNTKITKQEGNLPVAKVLTFVFNFGGSASVDNNVKTNQAESYSIRVVDESSVMLPYPDWFYSYSPRAGETMISVLGKLRTLINADFGVNLNQGRVVTMSAITTVAPLGATPGTHTFTLTGLTEVNFKAYYSGFQDYTVTVTVAAKAKHLTGDYIKQFESEGDLYNAVKADFLHSTLTKGMGKPSSLVTNDTALFTMYTIHTERTEKSLTPFEKHFFNHLARIVVPKDSAAETAYDTVFGVV